MDDYIDQMKERVSEERSRLALLKKNIQSTDFYQKLNQKIQDIEDKLERMVENSMNDQEWKAIRDDINEMWIEVTNEIDELSQSDN